MSNRQNVLVKLDNLRCIRSGEVNEAEPYMWTLFFKVDGDSVFFDMSIGRLQTIVNVRPQPPDHDPLVDPDHHGHKPHPNPHPHGETGPKSVPTKVPPQPTIFYTPGREGDLGRSARTGETLPIPTNIGEWRTTLSPIPFRPPLQGISLPAGIIGFIVVLLEEDNTPNSAMAAGKSTFDAQVPAAITELLQKITIVDQKIKDEDITAMQNRIQEAINASVKSQINPLQWFFVGGDMDDNLGSGVFKWDGKELQQQRTVFFSKTWGDGSSSDGIWQLNGHVSVL